MLTDLVAEGFGCSPAFLDGVASLAEMVRTIPVWTARPEQGGSPSRPVFSAPLQTVGAVADELPPAAWCPFVLREARAHRRCSPPDRLVWLAERAVLSGRPAALQPG